MRAPADGRAPAWSRRVEGRRSQRGADTAAAVRGRTVLEACVIVAQTKPRFHPRTDTVLFTAEQHGRTLVSSPRSNTEGHWSFHHGATRKDTGLFTTEQHGRTQNWSIPCSSVLFRG